VQALQELVERQLVDVLLEREVHHLAGVVDAAVLLHLEDALVAHAGHQLGLDLRVAEVEEVPRVVPHEAVLPDGLAVATHLPVGLEHQVAGGRP
jgi:hypothetical protein